MLNTSRFLLLILSLGISSSVWARPALTTAKPAITHTVVGDTLFILNEKPFTNPRPNTDKHYYQKLEFAIKQKNPKVDLKQAVGKGEYYFLAKLRNIRLLGGPRRNYTPPAPITYATLYGISDHTEQLAFYKKVCPPKLIEGNFRASDTLTPTIYNNYATQWNKELLPLCKARAEKMLGREMNYDKAWRKWATIRPVSYVITVQASTIANNRALKITTTPTKITALRLDDSKLVTLNKALNIDGLFQLVDQAIQKRFYKVEVSYDKRQGYPTSILIQEKVGGVVEQYQVSDFQTLAY